MAMGGWNRMKVNVSEEGKMMIKFGLFIKLIQSPEISGGITRNVDESRKKEWKTEHY